MQRLEQCNELLSFAMVRQQTKTAQSESLSGTVKISAPKNANNKTLKILRSKTWSLKSSNEQNEISYYTHCSCSFKLVSTKSHLNQDNWAQILESRYLSRDTWAEILELRCLSRDTWAEILKLRCLSWDTWTEILEPRWSAMSQDTWAEILDQDTLTEMLAPNILDRRYLNRDTWTDILEQIYLNRHTSRKILEPRDTSFIDLFIHYINLYSTSSRLLGMYQVPIFYRVPSTGY